MEWNRKIQKNAVLSNAPRSSKKTNRVLCSSKCYKYISKVRTMSWNCLPKALWKLNAYHKLHKQTSFQLGLRHQEMVCKLPCWIFEYAYRGKERDSRTRIMFYEATLEALHTAQHQSKFEYYRCLSINQYPGITEIDCPRPKLTSGRLWPKRVSDICYHTAHTLEIETWDWLNDECKKNMWPMLPHHTFKQKNMTSICLTYDDIMCVFHKPFEVTLVCMNS